MLWFDFHPMCDKKLIYYPIPCDYFVFYYQFCMVGDVNKGSNREEFVNSKSFFFLSLCLLNSVYWVCPWGEFFSFLLFYIYFYFLQEKLVGIGSSTADTGKGKSKMSKHLTHGYHFVKGKSYHDMEDYVFAQFKQVEDKELGLFAIFDGHLSHDIPDYLRSHLFENILNEVTYTCE